MMLKWLSNSNRGEAPSASPEKGRDTLYLHSEGRHEEAAAACRELIALNPLDVRAHEVLGCALASLGDAAGAATAFGSALRIDPAFVHAHCNRGLSLLSLGDYAGGWEEFEWRWKRPELQTLRNMFPGSWWDGSDLSGRTILLFAEQGFGDAIQFVRYASIVSKAGARVVVDCHPPLKALLRQVRGVTHVLEDDAEIPRYKLYCPLMSLPRLLATRPDSIPADVPYITPTKDCVDHWRGKVAPAGETMRIGLVWASNPATGYAWHKSVPLELFAPLGSIDGLRLYSLQTGLPAEHVAQLPPGLQLIDLSDGLRDFSDTAGFISNLDLVISVDTAVAHLAAAMGKTTWTLLPKVADWRWGAQGDATLWYPTMRLFRQQIAGDWSGVIARVGAQLRVLADGDRARRD